ncbi:MAG: hypothetical protein SAJ12_07410 [Jaaginema sp. PMC 1079.18]|nr:hypothetical protein [Jaaginema sp. PMC 1080.18]MEC4850825.1 hypothetical protein [Jaaginema sp. PMC 1079.18]MEC4868377.1 hypothetical protein [Jaaginema sp. PMC 1078.18]
MKIRALLRSVGIVSGVAIAIALGSSVAWSATPILDLDCVDADGKPSNNFEWSDRGFSVGKRYYQARMRAYPGAVMTCAIPEGASMLSLQFGLHDTSEETNSVSLTLYLDGVAEPSQAIVPGELFPLNIPLENASSFALSLNCNEAASCNSWVYFVNAEVD